MPVLESLINKVAGLLIKKRLQHRCFPMNITKFLRHLFFSENYLRTATSESITEFVQSIQIVQSF